MTTTLAQETNTPNTELEQHFLNTLSTFVGMRAQNAALIELLGWSKREYTAVKLSLSLKGAVLIGRGLGGSVAIAQEGAEDAKQAGLLSRYPDEASLYEPTRATLAAQQTTSTNGNANAQPASFERLTLVTAETKNGIGPYTRPDLTLLEIRDLPFLAKKEVVITTFEVKHLRTSLPEKMKGVYEAVAHQTFADHVYLAIFDPSVWDPYDATNKRIAKECVRLGVGLVHIIDPAKQSEWNWLYDARATGGHLNQKEQFLRETLGPKFKQELTDLYNRAAITPPKELVAQTSRL